MTPALLAAVKRGDTGSVVRLTRRALGMTQAELGDAAGYSQAAVSRLERGSGTGHDLRTLRLMATALAIPGSLLGVADSTEENSAPVNRRQFLHLSTAVVAAAASGQVERPVPGRVGLVDVAEIEQAVDDLRAVDQRAGGGRLQNLAVMQVRQARALLARGSYGTDVGRRLSMALGEAAILAGWFCVDAGHRDDATALYAEAITAAGAAGDDLVAAHAYANMSMLARATERPVLAVQYARAGQRAAARDGGPRLRALLFAREANGHATMGDFVATEEAVRRAERAFNSGRGSDPGWTAFFTDAELAGVTGAAFQTLGDDARGVGRLREAAEMLGRARNQAYWTFALADGLTAAGDPVQACAVAWPALSSVSELASARVHRQVRHLSHAMSQHARIPEVRDFRERVSTLKLSA